MILFVIAFQPKDNRLSSPKILFKITLRKSLNLIYYLSLSNGKFFRFLNIGVSILIVYNFKKDYQTPHQNTEN